MLLTLPEPSGPALQESLQSAASFQQEDGFEGTEVSLLEEKQNSSIEPSELKASLKCLRSTHTPQLRWEDKDLHDCSKLSQNAGSDKLPPSVA